MEQEWIENGKWAVRGDEMAMQNKSVSAVILIENIAAKNAPIIIT